MQGTAFVFGDEVNTDVITPRGSDYVDREIVDILMDPIRPNFSEEVSEGDIIVAGEHFGTGSSRETAPKAIKEAGISAVVAESFARIYYRNSVNIGLPAFICNGVTDCISEGDDVAIDIERGTIHNKTHNREVSFQPPNDVVQAIYDSGGLFEYYHEDS